VRRARTRRRRTTPHDPSPPPPPGLAEFEVRFPPELAPRLVWVYQWHNWRRIHGSRLLCSERMRAPGVISLSLTTYNPYITSLVVNTTDGWTTARGAFTFYGSKVRRISEQLMCHASSSRSRLARRAVQAPLVDRSRAPRRTGAAARLRARGASRHATTFETIDRRAFVRPRPPVGDG
jgi:hypothetical protein